MQDVISWASAHLPITTLSRPPPFMGGGCIVFHQGNPLLGHDSVMPVLLPPVCCPSFGGTGRQFRIFILSRIVVYYMPKSQLDCVKITVAKEEHTNGTFPVPC